MQKQEMITKVNESMGSLFTKEDVINLINQLSDETPTPSNIDFEGLIGRLQAIVDDSDDRDINFDTYNCKFQINNANEIEIDELKLDTDSFKGNINHEIRELVESVEQGEACQFEEIQYNSVVK